MKNVRKEQLTALDVLWTQTPFSVWLRLGLSRFMDRELELRAELEHF